MTKLTIIINIRSSLTFELLPYILTGLVLFTVYISHGDYQLTNSTSDDYCQIGVFIYTACIVYLPWGIAGVGLVYIIVDNCNHKSIEVK